MDADLVTLNDPMKGIIDYNINKFETRYDQMHRQAIVILPEEGTEPDESIYSETSVIENSEAVTETVTAETDVSETAVTESEYVSESETEQNVDFLW